MRSLAGWRSRRPRSYGWYRPARRRCQTARRTTISAPRDPGSSTGWTDRPRRGNARDEGSPDHAGALCAREARRDGYVCAGARRPYSLPVYAPMEQSPGTETRLSVHETKVCPTLRPPAMVGGGCYGRFRLVEIRRTRGETIVLPYC